MGLPPMSTPSPLSNKLSPALTGQRLVDQLHSAVGLAKHRLWIASPYIGAWKDVKRILGATWEKLDVRVLVDKDSGFLSRDTLERFAAHRPIHSLRGLHAKIYVIDNVVLMTSANLTGCAFKKRHEVGFLFDGAIGERFVTLYEKLWAQSVNISVEALPVQKRPSGTADEPHGAGLPDLWDLPSSPKTRETSSGAFSDYQHFLETYERFVHDYLSCGGRDVSVIPVYFETDAFLDFLFHSGDRPSQPFKIRPPRNLSDADRIREIAAARDRFRKEVEDKAYHMGRSRIIRKLLRKTHVMDLSQEEVAKLATNLNCFGRNGLARYNFVSKNKLRAVRTALRDLIHGEGSPVYRMENCKAALHGFGRSSIQETMGYYFPNDFPLRNQNVNAGLRFFGYPVSAK
jgi:hypothetical protein